MTASHRRSALPPLSELPQPDNALAIDQTFQAYEAALAEMARTGGIPALMEHLTSINAQLEAQRQARMASLLSRPPATSSSIDDPVVRSTTRDSRDRRPPDRGRPPSPSPQPTALDRLAASRGLGRRVVAKLVAAQARTERDG